MGVTGHDQEGVRVGLHPDEALVSRAFQAFGEVFEVVVLLDLAELVLIVEVRDKPVLGGFQDAARDRADREAGRAVQLLRARHPGRQPRRVGQSGVAWLRGAERQLSVDGCQSVLLRPCGIACRMVGARR